MIAVLMSDMSASASEELFEVDSHVGVINFVPFHRPGDFAVAALVKLLYSLRRQIRISERFNRSGSLAVDDLQRARC